MKEIFRGEDIRKAFPQTEYKIEPLDIQIVPAKLYMINRYNYQSNTVVFEEVKLWKEG